MRILLYAFLADNFSLNISFLKLFGSQKSYSTTLSTFENSISSRGWGAELWPMTFSVCCIH